MATTKKSEEKVTKSTAAKAESTGTTRVRRSVKAIAKKNFILDTNVILHDYKCLDNFEENDIYIPFVVLEELDKFKKGSDQINFNARAFVRELDLITDDDLFTSGADLGVGKGKLYIVNASHENKRINDAFPEKIPDNRILAVVDDVAVKHPNMKTILVSKDINLRMKARSLGM
ncbi:MAG: PhoH family protein, partial [Proteiniphilum acetatigenes]